MSDKNDNNENNDDTKTNQNIRHLSKLYLEKSFFSQVHYRSWILYKTWPLFFINILKINIHDTLTLSCMSTIYKSYSFLNTLSKAKNAVIENNYDVIESMLESGDIDVDDVVDPTSMQTMLHYAVLLDDPYLVDYLAKKDANLMVRDSKGFTPLIKACCLGREESVEILIENGVPLDHKDLQNNNCLSKARTYNNTKIVDYIESLPNQKINQEKYNYWIEKPLKERYNTRVWYIKSLY